MPLNAQAEDDKHHSHVMDVYTNGRSQQALPAPGRISTSQLLLKLLQANDFLNPESWRAAAMEFLATSVFVFSSICIIISCSQMSASPMTSISTLHFLVISFLILAVGASSGGHLNPCITFIAMALGYISPSRSFMYTVAQCLGGLVGTLLMKLTISHEVAVNFSMGGCMIRNAAGHGLPPGSAFILESFFTFLLIFVVATVAFDPIRSQISGPILAPMLIAATVGSLIFMSGGLSLGYSGAGMNPARCIGPAMIMGHHLWDGHWVFWVAPYFATVMVAIVYGLVPPHHTDIYRSKKDMLSKIKAAFSKQHHAVGTE